ncbi:MAG: hypothetical protein JSS02_30260 [Planctomycetes bacterium]|nr:hypothetical protein [Planctomycetota bacterium]
MEIIRAITDSNLFRPFLADADGDLSTWYNWLAALRIMYGLPVPESRRELVERCTGRTQFPSGGFNTALFLTGRRSGKSRIAAVIGAFEAALAGNESRLATGEQGIVAVISPTKRQSRIVRGYLRAVFDSTPMLKDVVTDETQQGFELNNGVLIEVLAGDWRTVRGHTLLAAIVDEAAFFGYDEESKVRSDTELIRAIKPSLATTGGKLIGISSPYARRGWCFNTYQRNFGKDSGKVLVWNCPSTTMNPTLPQSVVDEAMAEDLQAAKSEYLGEFRDDVCEFLPRPVIEALVAPGRVGLSALPDTTYTAFADLSGGRADDAALAIVHREQRTVIIDRVFRYRPPFNPYVVISQMADEIKAFGIKRVIGDNYAAEFVCAAFEGCGLRYTKCEKNKSVLYTELLPRMCSGEIELLDDPTLVNQLANLERRTRSGGKDIIDHAPGGHDDLANAVAGAAVMAATIRHRVGGLSIAKV